MNIVIVCPDTYCCNVFRAKQPPAVITPPEVHPQFLVESLFAADALVRPTHRYP